MASPASTSSYSCTTPSSSVIVRRATHFVRVHHDAHEVVVPAPAAQVQHRQHGLRRDGERHLVGDHEAVARRGIPCRAGTARRAAAGALQFGRGAFGQEGIAGQHGLPQRVGNRRRSARRLRSQPNIRRQEGDALQAGCREAQHCARGRLGARRPSRSARALRARLRARGRRACACGRGSRPARRPPPARLARQRCRRPHIRWPSAGCASLCSRIALRDGLALRQRPGQEFALPGGVAHLLAELHVIGVGQAQRVAVASAASAGPRSPAPSDPPAASCRQAPQEAVADQEVAVAVHEEDGRRGRQWPAARRRNRRSKPGSCAMSSPTQTSNRSPRMNTASAGVVCM